MEALSSYTLLEIFYELDYICLCRCTGVCKRWRDIINQYDEVLWKPKLRIPVVCTCDSWKDAFIQWHRKRYVSKSWSNALVKKNKKISAICLAKWEESYALL